MYHLKSATSNTEKTPRGPQTKKKMFEATLLEPPTHTTNLSPDYSEVASEFRFDPNDSAPQGASPAWGRLTLPPSPVFAGPESCALFGLLDEGQELSVERDHDSIFPLRTLDLRAQRETGSA